MKINNLSKSYGSTKALIDFSYEFGKGIYALLGPNGSGKSTLMNIITDNLKPDSGNITWNGVDTLKMGAEFREKIGFMPQNPGMYPAFTVENFLFYIAVLKGVEKKEADKQVAELLEAVELSDVRSRAIKTLSGGMKQRLALAQAMLGNPELIILDEPTAGLDPKQRISIRNYIARTALNRTIIIATHIVSDVEYIAKEIIFLKKGVIADAGAPEALLKKAEGKVWKTIVTGEQVPEYQQKFRILNIQNNDDGVALRILSDEQPTHDSVSVPPVLEDYYLLVFGDIL